MSKTGNITTAALMLLAGGAVAIASGPTLSGVDNAQRVDRGPGVGVIAPSDTDGPGELDYPYNPTRILLRFNENVAADVQDALIGLVGEARHRYTIVPGLVSVTLNDGVTVRDALAAVRGRDAVMYAEADYLRFEARTPNDPLYANNMWHLNNTGQDIGQSGTPGADINAEAAWDVTTGNPDLLIGIIDGGTDPNHPDIAPNIWVNPGEIAGNGIDDDGNGYVDDVNGWDFYDDDNDTTNTADHGSHVAGTVAAQGDNNVGTVGVVWEASIVPLKFIGLPAGSTGLPSGSTSDAVRALEYALDKGITLTNNSWGGGGFSSSLQSAIQAQQSINAVFVAASGNDGNTQASYPSRYSLDNVVSVAATDNRDNVAGFSNTNSVNVDLGAPGVNVASTVPVNDYAFFSGTSMASPHVAGVFALVQSEAPTLSYQDQIQIVFDNVRPVSSLQGITVTGGVVDAGATVQNLSVPPSAELAQPIIINPGQPGGVVVNFQPGTDSIIAGSGQMFYSINGAAFISRTMTHSPSNTFAGVALPQGVLCGDDVEIYFTFDTANFGQISVPENAPASVIAPQVGEIVVAAADSFNTDTGWAVTSSPSLTEGAWERGEPVGFNRGNPVVDADGSGFAYLTENDPFDENSDIDDGTTTLTSPVYSMPNGGTLSYRYWLNDVPNGELSPEDNITVEISTNGGSSWSAVRVYDSPSGLWRSDSIDVPATNQFRVRFTAGDLGNQNVVEAGIDAIELTELECTNPEPVCPADITGDGSVGTSDLLELLAQWGTSVSPGTGGDITGDGSVGTSDLLELLAAWGTTC